MSVADDVAAAGVAAGGVEGVPVGAADLWVFAFVPDAVDADCGDGDGGDEDCRRLEGGLLLGEARAAVIVVVVVAPAGVAGVRAG